MVADRRQYKIDESNMAVSKKYAGWNLGALLAGLLATLGVWHFSNEAVHSLKGEWIVVDVSSKENELTRLNVRKGTKVSIDGSGYLQTGRIGIDGIIGEGICGVNCGTFTTNGLKQAYAVAGEGEPTSKLTLTNRKRAATIVLERASEQSASVYFSR